MHYNTENEVSYGYVFKGDRYKLVYISVNIRVLEPTLRKFICRSKLSCLDTNEEYEQQPLTENDIRDLKIPTD